MLFWDQMGDFPLLDNDSFVRRVGWCSSRKMNIATGYASVIESGSDAAAYALRFLLTVKAAYASVGDDFWLYHFNDRLHTLHFPLICRAHFQGTARGCE